MNNTQTQTPRTATGAPATTPAQPLKAADQTAPPAAEEKQIGYSVKLYAVAPQGFVVEISTAAAERPVAWISTMAEGLERLHYTPIDPYAPANVDVDVAAAGAAPASSGIVGAGEATWIRSDNGAPPRCSIHGAAKWVEGDNDKGHYAFWACSYNTKDHPCKPKGKPA